MCGFSFEPRFSILQTRPSSADPERSAPVRRQNFVMLRNQQLEIHRECGGKSALRRVTRENSSENNSQLMAGSHSQRSWVGVFWVGGFARVAGVCPCLEWKGRMLEPQCPAYRVAGCDDGSGAASAARRVVEPSDLQKASWFAAPDTPAPAECAPQR